MNKVLKLSPQIARSGVQFECISGCVKCCAIPGKVFVTEDDVPRLAGHFNLSHDECKKQHLKHFWGEVYEFKYPESKPCAFLGETGCAIYDARPTQCRTFPFWPENMKDPVIWTGIGRMCPGVGRGRQFTIEEILEIARQLHSNPFL